MNLRELAIQSSLAFGLRHTSIINALRLYIKETPMEQVQKELRDINEAPALRAVWEAGVPKQLQETYFKQLNKVTGV